MSHLGPDGSTDYTHSIAEVIDALFDCNGRKPIVVAWDANGAIFDSATAYDDPFVARERLVNVAFSLVRDIRRPGFGSVGIGDEIIALHLDVTRAISRIDLTWGYNGLGI